MKKIGIALGGGGVRGLAHIPALEILDFYGITPHAITGTSMGAIIGALYASGLSGAEIRTHVEQHIITNNDNVKDIFNKAPDLLKWLSMVSLDMSRGGFLKTDGFLKHLFSIIHATTFEELAIPLQIVATNLKTGKEVVFSSGKLMPAIQASMAIPGIFSPAIINDQMLVDGGIVNNVPYNLLPHSCDYTIAIDVAPAHPVTLEEIPNSLDAILNMFDLLVEKVMENRRKKSDVSLYIHPHLTDIRVLDFNKIESVFTQSESAMLFLKQELKKTLNT